jgi:hypothetical protein
MERTTKERKNSRSTTEMGHGSVKLSLLKCHVKITCYNAKRPI